MGRDGDRSLQTMTSADVILQRAETQIAAGRLWRGKEILRGTLASRADSVLLERYGRLLDSMGDRYEAGKYLYLSGQRLPEYAAAIELFLARHAGRTEIDFVRLFPAAVRRLPFEQLPALVQQDLKSRGVREERFSGKAPMVASARYRWSDRLKMAAAVLICGIFVLALGLGIAQIMNWVWKVLFE